ncbi:alcohol dehydrogenase (NADP+) [Cladophialophora psammophila CBS 110553]|uniref:D-xylose reductase [NAD(P)H] n=1 Tax=Cladophialophora psammophila CBS 110553 TaxID=1182543 RepID=W9XWB5_9EURO|nr:alcohol dehydrogenase (NADP+) [Cladophialophora psammophila CBS 110553]EXJ74549.1 alcohol dehydrogenase (NADP+) [Cladophialophora psammophila CBS 110553]
MAPNSFSLSSRLPLPNGLSIPQIHLGVYLMSNREASQAVKWALEAGYRGVDSAQMYRNERACGQAILSFLNDKASNTAGLTREDIFFTSKLASNTSYDTARRSIRQSVEASGLGYIDLFLLHSPYGGMSARLSSWRAIEDAIQDGEIKLGGVSNFGIKHLDELVASKPRIMPCVNQIEVHPFNTRIDIVETCRKYGILIEAYAPLARALRMEHPTIVSLSKKYKCTPAQLMVRWSLQHGYIPLPKSVSRDRIRSNGDVGHFEISNEDMQTMDRLDEYLVTDWDPVDAD